MDISVVIPCFADSNIFSLLNLLDKDSNNIIREYIVVLVGEHSSDFIKKLKNASKQKIVIKRVEPGNISTSFNTGIGASQSNKILILNSDLVGISKDYLKRVIKLSKKYDVVKSDIIFAKNDGFFSNTISKSRTMGHINMAYNPGILVDMRVFKSIGFFNEKVHFSEDAEFDSRLKKSKFTFFFDKKSYITHPSISPTKDLKMAFNIGRGKYQSVKYAGAKDNEGFISVIKRLITLTQIRYFIREAKEWGFDTAIYDIFWFLFYYLGNYKERFIQYGKK